MRLAAAALLALAAPTAAQDARTISAVASPESSSGDRALPASALSVRDRHGRWTGWWSAERAPARWTAALPAIANAVAWRDAAPGVEWGELALAGDGEAWRLTVIVVRVDPARVRLRLDTLTRDWGTLGGWTLDAAPADAIVALNAGQFDGGRPWGWVVREGSELRPPGAGPLASTLVVDGEGRARLTSALGDSARRAARTAFQSYPTLLADDGVVPLPLRAGGRGVNVGHRDARLAVGELRDGRLLFLLTRFGALGESLGALPFGPTVPELAALMGALGCTRAVALDGGISAQLLVRDARETRTWRGLRKVPLALVILPR